MEYYNTTYISVKDKIFRAVGTVIFFLCFIPYAWVINYGINGIYFGMQDPSFFYGFSAMIITIIFSPDFFGLIPACIIFQLVYTIRSIRHRKELMKISFIISGAYVLAFILIGLSS